MVNESRKSALELIVHYENNLIISTGKYKNRG